MVYFGVEIPPEDIYIVVCGTPYVYVEIGVLAWANCAPIVCVAGFLTIGFHRRVAAIERLAVMFCSVSSIRSVRVLILSCVNSITRRIATAA
jgi:hypothetical protein